jgi:hypothetical protein
LVAKNTAAALGALTAVAIMQLLLRLGLGRLALPTALSTAVASNIWVDSQTLWQHVPAALALTLTLLWLAQEPVSRLRLFLAGLSSAVLVCIRPQDLLLAATIFFWVTRYHFREVLWFLPMPILLGGVLIGYNYWYFGMLTGGYGNMESGQDHSLRVNALVAGAAGNLFSPRRSLFVYCPWTAVALATIPAIARELGRRSIICWLLVALVPYLFMYSSNRAWWGGSYFGPRYFTDVMPLFAILLGFGLNWSWKRCPPIFVAFVVTLVLATEVQLIGAFYYPSTWESSPVVMDELYDPEVCKLAAPRAWDWHDNELSRCLAERATNREGCEWWLIGFAEEPSAPDPSVNQAELYAPGFRIRCTNPSSAAYLASGWHGLEPQNPDWQWSGPEATIRFKLDRAQPLRLRMMATTYGKQPVIIRMNDQEVATIQGSGELELMEVDLPVNAVTESNMLELVLPEAKSPKSIGESKDARVLGIGIAWIEFAERTK